MHADAQSEQHLLELDEIVLCDIIARLPEPACLAQTCKALLHASRNPLCKQLWLNHYVSNPEIGQGRHITYACLSWRGLAADSTPQQLVQFLLSAIQASPTARQQHQQQLQQASSLSKAGQWLQLLCLLAPRWQYLLLSAAAAHHSGVLAALLESSPASTDSSTVATAGADVSGAAGNDHHQLAADASSSTGNTQQLANTQQQQQQQQAEVQHPLHTIQLPATLRLPTYRHDQLQSAIISAAAAGQAQSLTLLLQQLSAAVYRNTGEKVDLLCSAAEAAAAGGSQACLNLLWETRPAPAVTASIRNSTTADVHNLAGQVQQLQLGIGSLHGRQLQQRLLCSSRYCLVAAASGGNAQLLSKLLQEMPQGVLVTQQLPAALQEAGGRGHIAALQVLLVLQEMSSRPLQVGTDKAGIVHAACLLHCAACADSTARHSRR
jgi:hypothetical protein